MAKQKGLIKLEGALDNIVFYKTKEGYIARQQGTVTAKRIATDPAFQRVRENNAEFGRGSKAGKLLRNAIRILLQHAQDSRVVSRLTKQIIKVIKSDDTNSPGQRTATNGKMSLLQGFEFNNDAPLSTTLYAPYVATIDRPSGALTVRLPSFIPSEMIIAPDGATHFKIVSMGAEVDFINETSTTDTSSTDILPWNTTATANISLANTVTFNSTLPLFLVLGIQYYQQVNAVMYPLKNSSFNALSLVLVSQP